MAAVTSMKQPTLSGGPLNHIRMTSASFNKPPVQVAICAAMPQRQAYASGLDCARAHRRTSVVAPRRIAAMALACRRGCYLPRCLTMADIPYVFTIARVAEMPGGNEEQLWEIPIDRNPEDGQLWVDGAGDARISNLRTYALR